jgi:hypothetical protein
VLPGEEVPGAGFGRLAQFDALMILFLRRFRAGASNHPMEH